MSPTPSPYQLLGIGPTASVAEVKAAFQAAVRARRVPTAQLQHAVQQLRSPRARLGHDILEPAPLDLRARFAPVGGWEKLVRPDLGPDGTSSVEARVGSDVVPPFAFPVLP